MNYIPSREYFRSQLRPKKGFLEQAVSGGAEITAASQQARTAIGSRLQSLGYALLSIGPGRYLKESGLQIARQIMVGSPANPGLWEARLYIEGYDDVRCKSEQQEMVAEISEIFDLA